MNFIYSLVLLILFFKSENILSWEIQTSADKMTDKKEFLMYQSSNELVYDKKYATIFFDCKKITYLELKTPNYIKNSSNPIKVRFDKEKLLNIYSFIFTDNTGAFLNNNQTNSQWLINKMKKHKKMLLQYFPIVGTTDIVEFDLTDFKTKFDECKKMK